ncbi:MAG: GNAT family N-acetyltransferase [Burkholderiaceae bacterium]|nr:GNAT family N-acetyltransferase [Burkholderiaceae bacterium]
MSWTIQPLHANDLAALGDHLMRLDATDRRYRFGIAMSDRQLVDFAQRCDPERDIFVVLKRGARIGGVCQLSVYRDAALLPVADLGISVDATSRRSGWATQMLRTVLNIARERRVTRLVVQYLRCNLAMAALVRSLGDVSEERHGAEVTASFALPTANGRTRVGETG